jgi:hypothetical protein
MVQFGLSSPRRVEALVARLVHSGFIEMVPSKEDRRVRILTPTERMIDQDLDWLAAHYLPNAPALCSCSAAAGNWCS